MPASSEIAGKLIDQLSGQIELLWTLSTATLAGGVALLVQVAFHNVKEAAALPLLSARGWRVYLTGLGLEVLAILFGYCAQGCLTNLTPQLYTASLDSKTTFSATEFEGDDTLSWLVLLQFVSFSLGIVLLVLSVLCNRKLQQLLRYEPTQEPSI